MNECVELLLLVAAVWGGSFALANIILTIRRLFG